MVTTRRSSEISLTVCVFGRSTSMPDCKIGAVIMKIISSTSITSTKGTMLMSESELPVWRASCGIASIPWRFALSCGSGGEGGALQKLLLDHGGHFHGKVIHAPAHLFDIVQKMIVSDDRW